MITIATLLTCFNRKDKTINALSNLYKALEKHRESISLQVFLTDDGSTDGTSKAVSDQFPQVKILHGNGSLYWAGGMRNSWSAALREKKFDYYLLLNDDTNIFPNLFTEFIKADEYSKNAYNQGGVYLGATKDPKTGEYTYGGACITNRFKFKYHFLKPNGKYQECDLGNANIMFVSKDVVDKVGMLTNGYIHGVADYDYTLKAVKNKQPVLLMPDYLGECEHDHDDIYDTYAQKPFKERLRLLKNPLGLDFKSNYLLMKNHFPKRIPLYVVSALLKLIFPRFYTKLSKLR